MLLILVLPICSGNDDSWLGPPPFPRTHAERRAAVVGKAKGKVFERKELLRPIIFLPNPPSQFASVGFNIAAHFNQTESLYGVLKFTPPPPPHIPKPPLNLFFYGDSIQKDLHMSCQLLAEHWEAAAGKPLITCNSCNMHHAPYLCDHVWDGGKDNCMDLPGAIDQWCTGWRVHADMIFVGDGLSYSHGNNFLQKA